ncbi:MAG: tol-pal system protein YbgF [Nitrospira sp.]|nr:tol-pal system protein YbgF [Nitrospira sp.]
MLIQPSMTHCALLGMTMIGLVFSGCMAQQSDLKKTEKDFKNQLSQTSARQNQEISTLREQELPRLRGELEKALHLAKDLQGRQEDFKYRSAQLEQQTKKLEQLAAKLEADSGTRYLWVQKSFETQDAKVSARLDEVAKAMEALKKELIEVVQRTNESITKRVDLKLDEQRRELVENNKKGEHVSQKFVQFNQALTGFREALTGLNDRVGEGEQVSKNLTAKIDAAAQAEDLNRSVASLTKALETIGKKITARLDEQDNRIDALAKTVEHVSNKPALLQQGAKSAEQSTASREFTPEGGGASANSPESEIATARATIVLPQESPKFESPQSSFESPDRARYDRLLTMFRDGDLEGARQGFAGFLSEYPNSSLAPNARFWLGESYYGKKDFQKAIDAYDKVEIDYPSSEKVPAALLKKGYAFLAMKDVKRAHSAFRQVMTLYPGSAEAGRASDKLAQLKEAR